MVHRILVSEIKSILVEQPHYLLTLMVVMIWQYQQTQQVQIILGRYTGKWKHPAMGLLQQDDTNPITQ